MAGGSNLDFPSTDYEEVEAVRQAFQLLTYSFTDKEVSSQELFQRCSEATSKALHLLMRLIQQKRALEQTVHTVRQELEMITLYFSDVKLKLETVQATASFTLLDVADTNTQRTDEEPMDDTFTLMN